LIHFPGALKTTSDDDLLPKDADGNLVYSDLHYVEAYKAMEELIASGKVKNIGISNFNCQQTQDILDNCKIKPVSNQFEINPYCRNDKLVELCQKNGIVPVAYGPFGGTPTPGKEGTKILEDPYINDLANKHNKSVGQIILRWLFQRDIVSIPKSTNPKRLKDNISVIVQFVYTYFRFISI
jgi:diketogulonate reductase-like aldo/keto reductase